jgi:hypothetical protein
MVHDDGRSQSTSAWLTGEEGVSPASPQASLVCGGSSGPAHGGEEAVGHAGTSERRWPKQRTMAA